MRSGATKAKSGAQVRLLSHPCSYVCVFDVPNPSNSTTLKLIVHRFGRDVLDTAVKWTGDLLRRVYGARAAQTSILDVGCGNGTMLVGLAAQGFSNLAGQDYSMASCELAWKVLERHGLSHIHIKVLRHGGMQCMPHHVQPAHLCCSIAAKRLNQPLETAILSGAKVDSFPMYTCRKKTSSTVTMATVWTSSPTRAHLMPSGFLTTPMPGTSDTAQHAGFQRQSCLLSHIASHCWMICKLLCRRKQYRSSVWHLLHPVGILVGFVHLQGAMMCSCNRYITNMDNVADQRHSSLHLQIITSCNSTREELVQEFCGPDRSTEPCAYNWRQGCTHTRWRLIDWVKTYPTFKFGGVEGSKVCTVAFQKWLP